MRTAIVFLTVVPHSNTLLFAEEIDNNTDFDVFIVSDSIFSIDIGSKYINYVNDVKCIEKGYTGCNISETATHINKWVIAYDKYCYLFCEKYLEYDFVWVFEDDVFIPSIQTLLNLHEKYKKNDLVTPNNFYNKGNEIGWHWSNVYDKIKPPYYFSMVAGCGMSRKMLDQVKEYKNKNNQLFYIEVMFNTLAMQNNLRVIHAFELKSIVWTGEWDLDAFLLLPNNVFHPKKDVENHYLWRNSILEAKKQGIKPVDRLPDFLKEYL